VTTTWVPRESMAKSAVVIAPMPLAKSKQSAAPSSAASFASAIFWVGLP
jgi:hypothetical protein